MIFFRFLSFRFCCRFLQSSRTFDHWSWASWLSGFYWRFGSRLLGSGRTAVGRWVGSGRRYNRSFDHRPGTRSGWCRAFGRFLRRGSCFAFCRRCLQGGRAAHDRPWLRCCNWRKRFFGGSFLWNGRSRYSGRCFGSGSGSGGPWGCRAWRGGDSWFRHILLPQVVAQAHVVEHHLDRHIKAVGVHLRIHLFPGLVTGRVFCLEGSFMDALFYQVLFKRHIASALQPVRYQQRYRLKA